MPGAMTPPPLLGICASGSNTGKTTLLTQLIPVLASHGIRVSVIKHAHHEFDIDQPGKDTYRIRKAGAVQTLIGSRQRWALMTELSHIAPERQEPELGELVDQLDTSLFDLVLVEGFKHAPIPRIEVFRPALGRPLLAGQDPYVIAVASDGPVDTTLPLLDLNDPTAVARFVMDWLTCQPGVPHPTSTPSRS